MECVSNLAANEMFGGETLPDCGPEPAGAAGEAVVDGITSLARQAAELVVVTNEVGLDGISYEVETMEYIRLIDVYKRQEFYMWWELGPGRRRR